MFSLCSKPNFSDNTNSNPAMSDCYTQSCRILVGGCSEINTVSRVRVREGQRLSLETDVSRDYSVSAAE